jgi:outer membrane protein OmpA-like peptidoglycan-associated protein
MKKILFLIIFLSIIPKNIIFSQSYIFEGNVFETGNRGYLSNAKITFSDTENGQTYCNTLTDQYGLFKCDVPFVNSIKMVVEKETYKLHEQLFDLKSLDKDKSNFLKIEMEKAPGYLFEITLANKRDNENQIVDAVVGTLIEVYNNTTEKEVLKLENHNFQEFKVNLQKGNHYTILVRKEGYLAKQMEVYVNIKGCIVCFEGISDIKPGVTENLTGGNEYGVYLANVEMEKVFSGKAMVLNNILYELNSAKLLEASKKELDKVKNMLKYNPHLKVELGSHTDSRGLDSYNQELSNKRAKAAVDYITNDDFISSSKIIAKGYGESVPKNKCSNGVPCSEVEHAANRRTEINITGISDEWVFKPLVNLKSEEKFQREYLSKTSFGGVELKKDSTTSKGSVKSELITKTEAKVVIDEAKAQNNGTQNKGNLKKNSVAKKDVINKKETTGRVILRDQEPVSDSKKSTENFTDQNIKMQVEEGVQVILFEGLTRLPLENQILKSIPNSYVYKDAFGIYYYFIAGFKTEADALLFLDDTTKKSFPNSKIVNVKNGKW